MGICTVTSGVVKMVDYNQRIDDVIELLEFAKSSNNDLENNLYTAVQALNELIYDLG